MNELVKKIMEKNRKSIDENFRIIMEDKLPTAELIKLEFESIRSKWVDFIPTWGYNTLRVVLSFFIMRKELKLDGT